MPIFGGLGGYGLGDRRLDEIVVVGGIRLSQSYFSMRWDGDLNLY